LRGLTGGLTLNFLNIIISKFGFNQLRVFISGGGRGGRGCCEYGNETSGFVNGGVFRGQLSGHQLLEQCSSAVN